MEILPLLFYPSVAEISEARRRSDDSGHYQSGHSRSLSDPGTSTSTSTSTPNMSLRSRILHPRSSRTRQTSHEQDDAAITPTQIPSSANIPGASVIELHAGQKNKEFFVHTELLTKYCPYFRFLSDTSAKDSKSPPISFPHLDETAFELFVRWLYGVTLKGPSNYDSMQYYLNLYVLALYFKIERLCNEVMDKVRAYYRTSNMIAPTNRLTFIYSVTDQACTMRKFLVSTMAYRVMCNDGMGQDVRDVLSGSGGGALPVDFSAALIECHRNGLADPREGWDCVWHEHKETAKCKMGPVEPWKII